MMGRRDNETRIAERRVCPWCGTVRKTGPSLVGHAARRHPWQYEVYVAQLFAEYYLVRPPDDAQRTDSEIPEALK